MKPRVYLETSVISYLSARPSRDLIVAAHQQITQAWWERRRHDFDVLVSELVYVEARAGDPEAALGRLQLLSGLPLLPVHREAQALATALMQQCRLPSKAQIDALHVAVAAHGQVNYLLTWNCRHIANAELFANMAHACADHGLKMPTLCTPEELLGDLDDNEL